MQTRESLGQHEPHRRNESESGVPGGTAEAGPRGQVVGAPPARPAGLREAAGLAEPERVCKDPKDGELCLSRAKPEETLVEARSGSDVQIDRQTWV